MALPATFLKTATVAPYYMGIAVFIVPGDPTFEIELQRAPDSGGVPGTGVTIAQLPPAPISGIRYRDFLPLDGAKRYYRYRHVRSGWTAGAWSTWTRPAIPTDLNSLPTNQPLVEATVAGGSANIETINGVATEIFGAGGRADIAVNGDFDKGLAYWRVKNGSVPAPNTTTSAAAAFRGGKGLSFDSSTSVSSTLYQATTPIDGVTPFGLGDYELAMLTRCKPGEQYTASVAFKVSSGTANVQFGIICWDANRALVTLVGTPNIGATTTYQELVATLTVPANTYYLTPVVFTGPTASVITWSIDELHWYLAVSTGKLAIPLADSLNFGDRRNAVRNPGFEDDITFWLADVVSTTVIGTTAANAHSGNKYVDITHTATVNVTQVDEAGATLYGEIVPGSLVLFGGWAKVVSGTLVGAVIAAVTADKDKASPTAHALSTTATAWTFLTGAFIAGSTDKYVGFKIQLNTPTGTAVVRFDDLFMVVISPASDEQFLYQFDNGSKTANFTIDWNNGNHQRVTLGAAGPLVITFTNPRPGSAYFLEVVQDATGSRTVTWPSAVIWPGGTTPTLTTTASRADGFTFFYDAVPGTPKYLGSTLGQNYAV